jgi:hypothetical protein
MLVTRRLTRKTMADTIDLKTQAGPDFADLFTEGANLSEDELVGLAARLLRGHEIAFLSAHPEISWDDDPYEDR